MICSSKSLNIKTLICGVSYITHHTKKQVIRGVGQMLGGAGTGVWGALGAWWYLGALVVVVGGAVFGALVAGERNLKYALIYGAHYKGVSG